MAVASEALFHEIDLLEGEGVLFADETLQLDYLPHDFSLTLITNRYDIAHNPLYQNCRIKLNDFSYREFEQGTFNYALVRLPKSKQLAKHIFNGIAYLVKEGGMIIITGINNEGIKNIIKKMENYWGRLVEFQLLGKGLRYGRFVRDNNKDSLESDYNLSIEGLKVDRLLENSNAIYFQSKPGIYGYNKIDQGSLFLIETILEQKQVLGLPCLDLGCGYGFLGVMLHQYYEVESIDATDNNITAMEYCKKNYQKYHVKGSLILDDAALSLEDHLYQTIISNPPFHQGFSTSSYLTEKFISATQRLLHKRGVAYIVVNRFIAIERICKNYNLNCEEIAVNGQFKVLRLSH